MFDPLNWNQVENKKNMCIAFAWTSIIRYARDEYTHTYLRMYIQRQGRKRHTCRHESWLRTWGIHRESWSYTMPMLIRQPTSSKTFKRSFIIPIGLSNFSVLLSKLGEGLYSLSIDHAKYGTKSSGRRRFTLSSSAIAIPFWVRGCILFIFPFLFYSK